MSVGRLSEALGNPGRLQTILYFLLGFNVVFVSWNHLAMSFIAADTKYRCNTLNTASQRNSTAWNQCHVFRDNHSSAKVPCDNGYTYYQNGRERTIISEWDLVCDDEYKSHLATTIYFVGVLLGGLTIGPLSDKFGRRPVFRLTMFIPALIGIAVYVLRAYYVAFVVLRCILGFFLHGLHAVSYVTVIELFAKKYRSTFGTAWAFNWAVGVMSLALIAYVIQDWRYIQLVITVCVVLQIPLVCLLPESFRWSLGKHQFEQAEVITNYIASFNKLPYPREAFDEAVQTISAERQECKPQKKYTFIDLFAYDVLRRRSLILSWLWFTASIGYYGIILNMASLAGNKYLNFFMGGFLELIAFIVTVFLAKRYSRRWTLCMCLMLGSLMGIAAGVMSEKADNTTFRQLTTVFAIIGQAGFAGTFCVIEIFTSELYPTVIRNVGVGACYSWARFGGIIAPQVLLLGSKTRTSVPFILFGCCGLVGSLLSLLLPETLNKSLVDTMEEAKQLNEQPGGQEMQQPFPTKNTNQL